MTNQTAIEAAKRIIAGRVHGPFLETGKPGDRAAFRFDTAARAYLWNRRVRGMGAARALELAAPYALRPYSERPPQWFGPRGGAGGRFTEGRDVLRWFESTTDSGLRFVGWSDELMSYGHTGYYSREGGEETLRGGVWQLPGRKGRARFAYGYAEFESRGEMNPGSAAIVVSDILESEPCRVWESVTDLPELREAARFADGQAERAAERRRDYDSAWQAGARAAGADSEALETRAELLPLLAELRSLRRSDVAGKAPNACHALRVRVDSLLETIRKGREERDSAWDDCASWAAEGWKAGFMDNAADGFRRAVALGYASRDDWRGPADANPCNAGAGA